MFENIPLETLLCGAFLGTNLWVAISDARTLTIPNGASLLLSLLYPLHVLSSRTPVPWAAGLLVAAIVFLAGLGLFARGVVGGGDVKFLSVVGLWAGPHLILPVLLSTALAGGVLALIAGSVVYLKRYYMWRYRAVGRRVPDTTSMPSVHLPYGIAIAFGGAYAGLQLLNL